MNGRRAWTQARSFLFDLAHEERQERAPGRVHDLAQRACSRKGVKGTSFCTLGQTTHTQATSPPTQPTSPPSNNRTPMLHHLRRTAAWSLAAAARGSNQIIHARRFSTPLSGPPPEPLLRRTPKPEPPSQGGGDWKKKGRPGMLSDPATYPLMAIVGSVRTVPARACEGDKECASP